jgi:DNA adenine methylase
VKTNSPLRYPGGKSSLAGLLIGIRRLNRLGSHPIAEPFAGGAGASLTLLFLEETERILINDVDSAIHAFWWAITNRSEAFLKLISTTRVSLPEWHRQLSVYRDERTSSKLKRGFAAFYLNRCNRSGILVNGGPIGGLDQKGKWKLDARFNKTDLRNRCQRVAEYRARITVSADDGIDFIDRLDPGSTFFFIDPPYFDKGRLLYLNKLDPDYHRALASKLHHMKDDAWVLTYDDCPEIRRLYRGWASVRPFSLRYVAAERRSGREVLITPKWMALPESQESRAIAWPSARKARR